MHMQQCNTFHMLLTSAVRLKEDKNSIRDQCSLVSGHAHSSDKYVNVFASYASGSAAGALELKKSYYFELLIQ